MERYAVFGNPISHSLSPFIHQLFAEQIQKKIIYEAKLVAHGSFTENMNNFFLTGGTGANITSPFKEQAFRYVNQTTHRARFGAVNTVIKLSNGVLLGDNSDGIGLVNDLKYHNLLWPKQRILLLGAGGAARGILPALLVESDPQAIFIMNRTFLKAQQLANTDINLKMVHAVTLNQIKRQSIDLIINTISASLPDSIYLLLQKLLHSDTICYDLDYKNFKTPFLSWAQKQKLTKYYNGLGMLVEQAAYSFQQWHGFFPDKQKILSILQN